MLIFGSWSWRTGSSGASQKMKDEAGDEKDAGDGEKERKEEGGG